MVNIWKKYSWYILKKFLVILMLEHTAQDIFAVLNCRQSKTLKHTPGLKVASLVLPSISVDL